MSDWQPIETAPKDGKFVILFPANSSRAQKRNGAKVASGYFHQPANKDHEGYWVTGMGYVRPTHWQPIPKPPSVP